MTHKFKASDFARSGSKAYDTLKEECLEQNTVIQSQAAYIKDLIFQIETLEEELENMRKYIGEV